MQGRPAIRLAVPGDLPLLPAVERQAAARFPPEDLPAGRHDETTSMEELQQACATGWLWIAVDASQQPVGFLLAQPHDARSLHIREMDVLPAKGGRGTDTALLDAVAGAAAARGFRRLTLTTFSHLPWNGPFYERRGFRAMDASEHGAVIADTLRQEAAAGLRHRIAMCKALAGPTTGCASPRSPGTPRTRA